MPSPLFFEGERKNEFILIMSVVALQRGCRPVQNKLESFENMCLTIGQNDKIFVELIYIDKRISTVSRVKRTGQREKRQFVSFLILYSEESINEIETGFGN